jgi:putative ABC transport system permease protein
LFVPIQAKTNFSSVKLRNFFLFNAWIWTMALRDARKNFFRLLLFSASLVSGIMAVVAISSLNYNLRDDLDRNARELLGADMVVNGNKKFDSVTRVTFDSTRLKQAQAAELSSMALFLPANQSRLVRLMAISGEYPFYGQIETMPADAEENFRVKSSALIDESLAVQYKVNPGDSIKLGNKKFQVSGFVRKFPGASGILQTFTPSVYINYQDLDSTGLVQFGSRVTFRRYFEIQRAEDVSVVKEKLLPKMKQRGFSIESVEDRKAGLGRAFGSVYRFFSLLSFIALILGCLGVASSVSIYAKEKKSQVATLRCLGATGWQTFGIYFIQITLIGFLSSIIGALLGAAIQQLIPVVFKDFIPNEVTINFSLAAVLEGLVTGIIVSMLFSAWPLLQVRLISPLSVLREDAAATKKISGAVWLVTALIILFPVLIAFYQTKQILTGLFFSAGIIVALLALWGTAEVLLRSVRKFFPQSAGFVFRYALASLFRPGNQTRLLVVTIGLGAFILSTLNIIQSSLLNQTEFSGNKNQPNTILFDIQSDQKDAVAELLRQYNHPVNQLVPIVTCRLSEVKGRKIEDLRADSTLEIPEWALTREYRVTYRDTLSGSETLVEGQVQSFKHALDSIHLTISEDFQNTLHVKVGDTLLFDLQGVPVQAVISGIRKVEWPKNPPNFIFVFPSGVMEAAPQTWVLTTRVPEGDELARFQQAVVRDFPNISLIDLSLVLSTINAIFDKVGAVVRFLVLFSLLTGLIVLTGTVVNSRFSRIREYVLLRTLGASGKQILRITLIEYAYLGLFSTITGLLLAFISGFIVCTWFFEVKLRADFAQLGLLTFAIVLITTVIGWFNSRSVLRVNPIESIRS